MSAAPPRRHVTLQEMLDRNLPPRQRLARLVEQYDETFAGLSRMLRRSDGYLQRFSADGVPSRLRPGEVTLLARYFRVAEDELAG